MIVMISGQGYYISIVCHSLIPTGWIGTYIIIDLGILLDLNLMLSAESAELFRIM